MLRPMNQPRNKVPTIPALVARCDAYCEATGRSRVWLSKRLFSDTDRLEALATRESTDVGVRVMERVDGALSELERAARNAPRAPGAPGPASASA